MFGYAVADIRSLSPAAQRCYRSVYCGICGALKTRAGSRGHMTLTYDAAFLAIVLTALFSREGDKAYAPHRRRCVMHPLCPAERYENRFIAYAADMNLLLAHAKLGDDIADEGKFSARIGSLLLSRPFRTVSALYPLQTHALRTHLSALSAAEKRDERRPEIPAGCFGLLTEAFFDCGEDLARSPNYASVREPLRRFGNSVGRLIYLMDAATDLQSDLRHLRYNPLTGLGAENIHAGLLSLAEGCTRNLCVLLPEKESIPGEILRNVLQKGIWLPYAAQKGLRL